MSCVPFSSLLIPSNFNMFDLQRGAIGSKRHDGLHSHRTVKRSDVFGNRKQYFPIVLLQSVRTQSRQSVPGIVAFLAFRSRRTQLIGLQDRLLSNQVTSPVAFFGLWIRSLFPHVVARPIHQAEKVQKNSRRSDTIHEYEHAPLLRHSPANRHSPIPISHHSLLCPTVLSTVPVESTMRRVRHA